MAKPLNWKIIFILLAGAIFGLIAVLPYSFALQGEAVSAAVAQAAMPLWQLITIQIASQVIVFGVAIWIGLSFANSVDLGAPLLEDLLNRNTIIPQLRRILPLSIALGVILALLIIGLEVLVFQPALLAQLGDTALAGASALRPKAWQGFLASFYGAINEEILLRL